MPVPEDSVPGPSYLYEMMQRLSIDPAEAVVPHLSMAYMTAFHRCQTCPVKKACREWLDCMPGPLASAAKFCPNDDILFELRINRPSRASAAADHHAHIADLERLTDELNDPFLSKAADEALARDLKFRREHLREEIEWLRRKPSNQACVE